MKTNLYAILLVIVNIKAAAQSDVATAKWKQTPVVIDGKLTEWNLPLRFYDADTKLFFDIANDSSNIYLCFESNDEMSQAKMMRAGMKITLSTKGKAKREATIAYPLSPKQTTQKTGQEAVCKGDNVNASDGQPPHDRSSYRNRFIQTHSVMDVEGFATAKGEIALANPFGIAAAIDWDTTSNLGYEIAIPKKEFFGADYASKDMAAADINLTVEINALPRSPLGSDDHNNSYHNHDAHDNGEEPGGRRGQFTGGGYNTGNEGAGRQWSDTDKVSLNTKSSFKQKFTLVKDGM